MIKYKYSKVYWFFRSLEWMRVYFSPFKPIIPRLYIGKIAIGTPYFLPRRLVKATPKRAHEATLKEIENMKNWNKNNPTHPRTVRVYEDIFQNKMNCSFFESKVIGFDFVSLGFKTKWTNTDYRQEWNPTWSFVCFGYQIALIFSPENDSHYWECFLYYSRDTNKSKSRKERIEQARKEFPCRWRTFTNGVEESICYWDLILRDNYLK